MDEIAFEERVKVACIHFDWDAIVWHKSYMKSRNSDTFPTWTEYVLALHDNFGEGFEDHMEAIKNLKQTGSVKDYQTEFNKLFNEVNLSTENAISCFLGGLNSELNKAVKIQAPRTLMQTYKIARLQEGVFDAQAQSRGLKFKPLEPNSNIPGRSSGNNYGRRLSAAEMDEKRAQGLCFFYDEKYVQGHNCRARKQLFLVDIVEEDTKGDEQSMELVQEITNASDEFMTISLQAFTGVSDYQTIRVTGYHEKSPLQVLIDTGSTHNFIDQAVARKLGCKADSIVEQSISVADGRKVQTTVCRNLQWLLQGTTFSSNFLLLPLANVDIVLGV
ncbi:uncharacterized protein [Nicotiana tomentosiformis]|uniref:uncharacterized protein n=1 Tax=Nicotiana tomentosiformis TaxID=4098 RepID=UPI00388C5249